MSNRIGGGPDWKQVIRWKVDARDLKSRRNEARWTQEQASIQCGITRSYYALIECGKFETLSDEVYGGIRKLCAIWAGEDAADFPDSIPFVSLKKVTVDIEDDNEECVCVDIDQFAPVIVPAGDSLLTTVTRPAALVRQGSLKLFATSIKVADLMLPNFYRINKLDPEEKGPGYQRILNEGRAKRLTDYLLDGEKEGDAFLPTSIFLATSRDIPFDPATNTITFDVSRVGPFDVVDGQHRIAGLVGAAAKNPSLLQFEIPVNIAVGLNDVSQMCHFLIVNTTQRSVDKAIEQQIIARLTAMVELEDMPTIPRWIRRQVLKGEDARALNVANFLNDDANSPWRDKIRMANDSEDKSGMINQKSFVNSLKKYIFASGNPLSHPDRDTMRPMLLSNYWKAIVELLVDENSPKPSVIFKTSGVDLFHLVSTTVFTHLNVKRDYKKETIKDLFRKAFVNLSGDSVVMSDCEWWQSGGGASDLNSSGVRKLANALNHAINVQDNIGEISL